MSRPKHTAYDILNEKGLSLGQVTARVSSQARLIALEAAQIHSTLLSKKVVMRNRSTGVSITVDRDQITPTP